MADVQKRPYDRKAVGQRDVIRLRRRRTMALLVVLALATAGLALWKNSLPLLLIHLFIDSLIALYLVALSQMKQQRQRRLEVVHLSERPTEWEEPQVKVIAN
jgi:predicted MFS family arabinose efflux permease